MLLNSLVRVRYSCLRSLNTLADEVIEGHRKSTLNRRKNVDADYDYNSSDAPEISKFRNVQPDLLPSSDWRRRDRVCEKLCRMDMYRRRKFLDIPEFYVGSIMAVTVSDPYGPGKKNRFVGICIQRLETGLYAKFRLRNIVDGLGVEIVYDLYNPSLLNIEVLRLEKRLDPEMLYLRDAPAEYSTVDFEYKPELGKRRNIVIVNNLKVPLNPVPWQQRWDIKGFRGIEIPPLPFAWMKKKFRHFNQNRHIPDEKYDLMKRYNESVIDYDVYQVIKRKDFEKSVAKG